ncbi:NADH-ubiquinone oxidoreductase chain L [hydrothermal vent metagenome]|uniref:NADH-ubiquinone oxidoreductase chain L n=1 Tax=hydrothermal vent metagenome TaxID=652676 RepID=A0A1W1C674_9ZZZZ
MRLLTLIISIWTLWFTISLFDGSYSWQFDLSTVGIDGLVVALKATHLANFFALLVSLSFVIIAIFGFRYKVSKGFHLLFYLLIASLFLILYARDYLLFFIGWEVMSVTTYLLLSYTLSREALIKYILFAMASAMSLLSAIVILYSSAHSLLYIDAYKGFGGLSIGMSILFVVLMLFAIFVKIGAIGFHYWLVDSYEQSSDLFTPFLSAILSKMGVYALIIFVAYAVDVSAKIGYILAIVGVATSIIAAFKALNEDSLKRLLAYSSIAQLGYIVTALSLADGMSGALYHSLIHTLVKLLLFINVAGIIYVTSRSKFSELGGLIYRMPQSFVLLLIGIIVLAGMPPLSGFASKFLIYTSLLEGGNLLILSAMMFAGASAFLYIYKLIYGIYLGHPTNRSLESVREAPFAFLFPQYIISAILILLSAYPAMIVPYFNKILKELKIDTLTYIDSNTISTKVASYDGLIVLIAFIVVFALVTLFLASVSSKSKSVKDRFDIAYCGEVPNESTHLHYGYSMGREIGRIGFVGVILRNSIKSFYDYLSRQLFALSQVVRAIYSGNLSINFNIAILSALILLWWGLK